MGVTYTRYGCLGILPNSLRYRPVCERRTIRRNGQAVSLPDQAPVAASPPLERGSHYKWIALSNTTLGVLMVMINQSIVLIALPDIFRGIHLNPLDPSNTSYLLW